MWASCNVGLGFIRIEVRVYTARVWGLAFLQIGFRDLGFRGLYEVGASCKLYGVQVRSFDRILCESSF